MPIYRECLGKESSFDNCDAKHPNFMVLYIQLLFMRWSWKLKHMGIQCGEQDSETLTLLVILQQHLVLLIWRELATERYLTPDSDSFVNSKEQEKKKKKSKGQRKVFCFLASSLVKKIIFLWAPGWLSALEVEGVGW